MAYLTILAMYLACLGTVISDIKQDEENDMTMSEKVFWCILAPVSVALMIRHDLKNV